MIRLVKISSACPEQYIAYDGGKQVGYLRLRWGQFSVECPGLGGDLVFHGNPSGDGSFEDDERDRWLRFAVDAIERWMRGEWRQPEVPDVRYEIVGAADV